MAAAIHIEINILFLLILCVIAWQITNSVSKQTTRILFRHIVFSIMLTLFLDTLWMLIDGHEFPGGVFLNKLVNAVFLGMGISLGGLWYQYVLEALGYNLSRRKVFLTMLPGTLSLILNIISMRTGWIFYIDAGNVYTRGPWFWVQTCAALFMLFISFFHLLIVFFLPGWKKKKDIVKKLLTFYFLPVIGTVLSVPFTGMPGTWTCASVSVILMYMRDQDDAILRDSLTGLNNRKTLVSTYTAYSNQVTEKKNLYLFMLDLNFFKRINDTFGHPVGDQALVDTAQIIRESMSGKQGVAARYGGDEFILMSFFEDDPQAQEYMKQIKGRFEKWNKEHDRPYKLTVSIGYSRYHEKETLEEMIRIADEDLYKDKKTKTER